MEDVTKEMIDAMSQDEHSAFLKKEFDEADRLHEEAMVFLYNNGEKLDLGKWVTAKEYSERFGVKINRVTNWIRRGIIPPENVRRIKALNDIRLIKAVPYKEV